MFFSHLLIALLAVQEVTCKKFGGFRIKLFKKELSTNRLPLGGLFASSSDNSNGGMVGSEGGGLRGGSIGGGGSGGGGVATPGQNDINFGNGDDDKKAKQAGIFFFLSSILKSYTNLLEKSPYPTKMVTSAIIGALGDYLVQSYEGRKLKKSIDLRRVIVFATVCGLYIAPVIHIWFEYLNTMPFLLKLGKYSKAFAMMFVDQSVGATVITLGFFFAFEAAQALYPPYTPGKKFWEAGWQSVKSNLGVTMIANWTCWPIINFFNFLLVPLEFRVLFANFAAVFWNMFLSQIANREIPKSL